MATVNDRTLPGQIRSQLRKAVNTHTHSMYMYHVHTKLMCTHSEHVYKTPIIYVGGYLGGQLWNNTQQWALFHIGGLQIEQGLASDNRGKYGDHPSTKRSHRLRRGPKWHQGAGELERKTPFPREGRAPVEENWQPTRIEGEGGGVGEVVRTSERDESTETCAWNRSVLQYHVTITWH